MLTIPRKNKILLTSKLYVVLLPFSLFVCAWRHLDMLHHLVQHKRLTQIIKIFPVKCADTVADPQTGNGATQDADQQDVVQHDEDRLFTVYLTEAIDRDRAERLGEMIKTTGYQLYETYNRNKQFFN